MESNKTVKIKNFCDYYVKPFPKPMYYKGLIVMMESLKFTKTTSGIAKGTGTVIKASANNFERIGDRFDDWRIDLFEVI